MTGTKILEQTNVLYLISSIQRSNTKQYQKWESLQTVVGNWEWYGNAKGKFSRTRVYSMTRILVLLAAALMIKCRDGTQISAFSKFWVANGNKIK